MRHYGFKCECGGCPRAGSPRKYGPSGSIIIDAKPSELTEEEMMQVEKEKLIEGSKNDWARMKRRSLP